jgi:hypothetical protein
VYAGYDTVGLGAKLPWGDLTHDAWKHREALGILGKYKLDSAINDLSIDAERALDRTGDLLSNMNYLDAGLGFSKYYKPIKIMQYSGSGMAAAQPSTLEHKINGYRTYMQQLANKPGDHAVRQVVRDFINDNSIRDKIKTYAPRVGAAAAAGVGTALTSKAMKELSDKALTSKAMKELSDK